MSRGGTIIVDFFRSARRATEERRTLEQEISRRLAPGLQAIAFDHGRTAMHAIFKSFGVAAGDEIILSAYTCHSVPQTIRAMGAKNVYVDIDPATFGPAAEGIAKAISSRTKAIL